MLRNKRKKKTIAKRVLEIVTRFASQRPDEEHPGVIVGPRNCIRDIHGSTIVSTRESCRRGRRVAGRIGEELLGSVRPREGEERRTTPDGNVAGGRRFSIKPRRRRCRYAGRGDEDGRKMK